MMLHQLPAIALVGGREAIVFLLIVENTNFLDNNTN